MNQQFQQNIVQIGNSIGVVIPGSLRKQLSLSIGDTVLVSVKKRKKTTHGVTAKFMKTVDEFMQEHKDVLQELAKR